MTPEHSSRAWPKQAAAGEPRPPSARRRTEIGLTIPEDALILITTRNLVLFPGTVLPMTLGRQRSVLAAQTAIRLSRPVGLVLQRDPRSTRRCRPTCTRSAPKPICCAT